MYIHPTQDQGRGLLQRGLQGPVVMLNLLRFRDVADYSEAPDLAPAEPVSGEEAYRRYMAAVTPLIEEAGSELLYQGVGGSLLIGPADETWDLVLLVKHESVSAFMTFATDKAYLSVAGHRTAALADSRLLPMQ